MKISDDTIEKLRGIFQSLDDDHSCTPSVSELLSLQRSCRAEANRMSISTSLKVEEIDDALERLEVQEPIRIEMVCGNAAAFGVGYCLDARILIHEIDVDGSGTVNYTESHTKPEWCLHEPGHHVRGPALNRKLPSEVHRCQHLREQVCGKPSSDGVSARVPCHAVTHGCTLLRQGSFSHLRRQWSGAQMLCKTGDWCRRLDLPSVVPLCRCQKSVVMRSCPVCSQQRMGSSQEAGGSRSRGSRGRFLPLHIAMPSSAKQCQAARRRPGCIGSDSVLKQHVVQDEIDVLFFCFLLSTRGDGFVC